jgi:hypothetical protein
VYSVEVVIVVIVVVVGAKRGMALVEGHKMMGTALPMYHRASEVPPMNQPMFDPMQMLEVEEAPMSELIRVGNSHMSSSEHLLVVHLKILASWVAVFGKEDEHLLVVHLRILASWAAVFGEEDRALHSLAS